MQSILKNIPSFPAYAIANTRQADSTPMSYSCITKQNHQKRRKADTNQKKIRMFILMRTFLGLSKRRDA